MSYYKNGVISIPNVSGDVVITATAVASALPYTNLADPSSSDWHTDMRIKSDGSVIANVGTSVTNYIPLSENCTIYIKGLGKIDASGRDMVELVTSNMSVYLRNLANGITYWTYSYNTDNDILTLSNFDHYSSGIRYARFCGKRTETDNDVIITINEPIT